MPAGSELASESLHAILGFLGALGSIGSIQKIAYSTEGLESHLWILLCEENLEAARQIYLLADEHLLSRDVVPIQVHVVPLSEVDEQNLPPLSTIFQR